MLGAVKFCAAVVMPGRLKGIKYTISPSYDEGICNAQGFGNQISFMSKLHKANT